MRCDEYCIGLVSMPTGVATNSIIREDLAGPSSAEALKVDPKGPA
jgi:hydroxymethylglutaryl-CoA reductase